MDAEKTKAMKMLEMLRVRTEARGATPAEAEQAALMVDRICKRYGIEPADVDNNEAFFKMQTNQFPIRCYCIARCVASRFGIEHTILKKEGYRSWLKFSGPEHLVSVACWLFKAITNDIENRSVDAGRAAGLKAHAYRTFRDKFRMSAALAVRERLAPEPPLELNFTDAELIAARKRLKKMTRSQRRKLKDKQKLERHARQLGVQCGMEVEIGTNAVGDRRGKTLAIEH